MWWLMLARSLSRRGCCVISCPRAVEFERRLAARLDYDLIGSGSPLPAIIIQQPALRNGIPIVQRASVASLHALALERGTPERLPRGWLTHAPCQRVCPRASRPLASWTAWHEQWMETACLGVVFPQQMAGGRAKLSHLGE